MTIHMTQLLEMLTQFLLPFVRIAAVFSVAPVIGSDTVPPRLRIAMAVPVAALVATLIPPLENASQLDPLSATGISLIGSQLIIGLAIGFALRLVFSALEIAGQAVSTQMGLGFAEMTDPQNGARVPALGHLYTLTGTLVFLGLNGHLHLLQLLVDSFSLLPPAEGALPAAGARELAHWGSIMFHSAVMVALPAMASLLAVNLALGVMTRAVPQFNMFIAFPLLTLMGIIILAITIPQIGEHMDGMLNSIFATVRSALSGGR